MNLDKVMDKLNRATDKAFQRIRHIGGGETDQDLALYNSLKPEDFVKLMGVYGEDNILGYINSMEHKRMGGKK